MLQSFRQVDMAVLESPSAPSQPRAGKGDELRCATNSDQHQDASTLSPVKRALSSFTFPSDNMHEWKMQSTGHKALLQEQAHVVVRVALGFETWNSNQTRATCALTCFLSARPGV